MYVVEIVNLTKSYGFNINILSRYKSSSNKINKHKPALSDINFSIKKGESFGIIGRNGSGKSTLLQIIAGTLKQTKGTCIVNGRLSALLELGSGFNPEFSGRENIYLTGSILGISRAEMEYKLPKIEEFADVGNYIDDPVRTYSTGMLMRVAFAVSIAVEPDILIIDEALSVGDILFQQKCNLRLKELLNLGITLIVVTHDTSFVLNICNRALWLHEGKQKYLGSASDCVREYLTAMAAISGNNINQTTTVEVRNNNVLPVALSLETDKCERLGNSDIYINKIWLLNDKSEYAISFNTGDWITVSILIKSNVSAKAVSAGCEIRDRLGQVVFATGLRVIRRLIEKLDVNESKLVKIKFKADLAPAEYTLDVGCGAGEGDSNIWNRVKSAAVLKITNSPSDEVVHGFVRLPTEIDVYSV